MAKYPASSRPRYDGPGGGSQYLLELQIHDGLDSRDGQLVEGDHVVDTIQELGAERRGKGVLILFVNSACAMACSGAHGHHLSAISPMHPAAGGLSLVVGTSLGRMLADDLRTHALKVMTMMQFLKFTTRDPGRR